LNGTIEVRTGCRECPQITVCGPKKNHGLAPELHDRPAVFFDFGKLTRFYAADFRLSLARRLEVRENRIQDGTNPHKQASAKNIFEKISFGLLRFNLGMLNHNSHESIKNRPENPLLFFK
jgi:hypothetical protein